MSVKRSTALLRLFDSAHASRTPLMCTFELNRNCNLQCRHCYLTSEARAKQLKTPEIKKILRQLFRAGTLYLVFTGGEIFLRKDIFELCAYARKLRFDLRLFTNGTLIDRPAAERIAALNISAVEISLYGKKITHDKITRQAGSFEKSVKAVKMLTGLGVRVVLKTSLTTINFRDFEWLKSFAKKLKVKLQVDPVITAKDDGNKSTLKYRINGAKLKSVLLGDNPSPGGFIGKIDPSGLLCSAGRNLVSIRSDGNVYPCLQLPVKLGNLKHEKFSTIWNAKSQRIRGYLEITPDKLRVCSSCRLSQICQRCPGLALTEGKDLLGPSKTACKIAKIRKTLVHC